ncbi:sensor domain-containing diguanylate cyclase [Rhizobium sp. S163]|uniref:sensor domain-containing protein n=1 Tax=Rhizobium sp. S163 TaxID=3055039 RepID=UPI0025A9AA7C|nr:sensor domain-containing diguanylate cyclase [Rhizobium sp. S163]MDM9646757.1 diguanylate cyclase [Rhizobium sp. S163]
MPALPERPSSPKRCSSSTGDALMTRPDEIAPLQGASETPPEERVRLFDNAFETAIFGLTMILPDGRIVKANRRFAELVGRDQCSLEGMSFSELTHPGDVAPSLSLFDDVLTGRRDGYRTDKRYVRPDRSVVETVLTVTAMRRESGELVRILCQIEDVTELRKVERALTERATQLELAMEALRGGFWDMDVPTRAFQTSERLARFIGGPEAARMDLEAYLAKVNPEDYRATDLTPLLEGEVDKSVAEYRLHTVAGERWMRCDRRLLRDDVGSPMRIIGVVIDFTEEHLRRQTLEMDADTDQLTTLYNRRGILKKFQRLDRANGVLVVTIDLDGFKEINDAFGHSAGDLVLIETAERLKAAVRPHDAVSRLGGDEFLVVMSGDGSIADVVARRIVDALAMPIDLAEGVVLAEGSVGAAWTRSPGASLEDLALEADRCLYKAKALGKKNAVVRELS